MNAVVLAIIASIFWGIGNTLQKHGMATSFPKISMRDVLRQFVAILTTLLRNWMWLLGLACMLCGMALFATALGAGDITLVQPIVCLTAVVAAIGGVVFLKEKVTRKEWAGIAAICVGVVFVGAAGHGATSQMPTGMAMIALNAITLLAIIGSLGLKRLGASLEFTLAVGAGLSFGLSNVMGKVLTQRVIVEVGAPFSLGRSEVWASLGSDYPIVIVLACNVIGAVLQQTAFANGRASVVAPILTIISNVLPIVAALAFFGEQINWLHGLGIAIVVIGTALLGLKVEPKTAVVPAAAE